MSSHLNLLQEVKWAVKQMVKLEVKLEIKEIGAVGAVGKDRACQALKGRGSTVGQKTVSMFDYFRKSGL